MELKKAASLKVTAVNFQMDIRDHEAVWVDQRLKKMIVMLTEMNKDVDLFHELNQLILRMLIEETNHEEDDLVDVSQTLITSKEG